MSGAGPSLKGLTLESEAAPQRRNEQSFDDAECSEQCDDSSGSGNHGGVECPAPVLIGLCFLLA